MATIMMNRALCAATLIPNLWRLRTELKPMVGADEAVKAKADKVEDMELYSEPKNEKTEATTGQRYETEADNTSQKQLEIVLTQLTATEEELNRVRVNADIEREACNRLKQEIEIVNMQAEDDMARVLAQLRDKDRELAKTHALYARYVKQAQEMRITNAAIIESCEKTEKRMVRQLSLATQETKELALMNQQLEADLTASREEVKRLLTTNESQASHLRKEQMDVIVGRMTNVDWQMEKFGVARKPELVNEEVPVMCNRVQGQEEIRGKFDIVDEVKKIPIQEMSDWLKKRQTRRQQIREMLTRM